MKISQLYFLFKGNNIKTFFPGDNSKQLLVTFNGNILAEKEWPLTSKILFSSAEGAAKSFHCKKNSGGYFLNKNKNLRIAQSYVSVRCFVSRRKETFCVPKKSLKKIHKREIKLD